MRTIHVPPSGSRKRPAEVLRVEVGEKIAALLDNPNLQQRQAEVVAGIIDAVGLDAIIASVGKENLQLQLLKMADREGRTLAPFTEMLDFISTQLTALEFYSQPGMRSCSRIIDGVSRFLKQNKRPDLLPGIDRAATALHTTR